MYMQNTLIKHLKEDYLEDSPQVKSAHLQEMDKMMKKIKDRRILKKMVMKVITMKKKKIQAAEIVIKTQVVPLLQNQLERCHSSI